MTRHRFFLPPECFRGEQVVFSDEASHQIRNVLRIRSGETVIALDGTGREFVVRLEQVATRSLGTVLETRQNQAEPRRRVVLYQGLLKGERLELVVQKCTEIGIGTFVLMETERSVAGPPSSNKLKRLRAIAKEAAEQSGRGGIPSIEGPVPLNKALERAAGQGEVIFPWEEAGDGPTLTLASADSNVGLFIGPEGGFTESEARQARQVGAQVISLGPRILRSETAAIVASALLLLPFPVDR